MTLKTYDEAPSSSSNKPLSPIDPASSTESLPHPYSGYYHCWPCRKRMIDTYIPEIKRRRLVSSGAKHRLFVKIHFALLNKAAEPKVADSPAAETASRSPRTNSHDVRSYADATAEKQLWLAVFVAALEDLSSRGRVSAAKWFSSSNIDVGSFRWICGQFGLNHVAARERILKSSAADLRRRLHFKRPHTAADIHAQAAVECFKSWLPSRG